MARINLLPWREERRRQRQRQFYSALLGSAVLAGLVGLYVHMHIAGLIEDQRERNNYLTSETALLEKKIQEINELEGKKTALIQRMDIIQQLQQSRPLAVHLFDEVAKVVPDGIYYTSLQRKGEELTVDGVADSNARVSALMTQLDDSPWIRDSKLEIVQTGDKGNVVDRKFTLQGKQDSPAPATEVAPK